MLWNEGGSVQERKLSTESYRGQSDHPEYIGYLRDEHGVPNWVKTREIMESWSDGVIISEGFASCFPVIAIDPEGKCQMVHFSRDPWRLTDTDEYQKKVEEWERMKCEVVLMRAQRSAVSRLDTKPLADKFGSRFVEIDLGVNSRFGMVIDVKKRIVLVQLTDAKELRKYQI